MILQEPGKRTRGLGQSRWGILRTVKPTEFFCQLPGLGCGGMPRHLNGSCEPLHFLRVRFRDRLSLTLDRTPG